ncbi:major facilitator superfamily domain-containing protein 3 [Anolis carolinensis]|uniref:major facilitator superfamily domain-containing protein 3 n=1 Tax=Anolis carolinensis TaxID=28377 RepID=UPI002F2B8E36
MNIKYVLLGMLYFVQGIPYGLQSGLLPIYFRSVGLSFTRISLAKVLYAPWILKVLWAPLVDHYLAKKTWLLFTMSGLVLSCLACSLLEPDTNFLPVALVFLFMNFCASIQDIAVDGVAIQLLGYEEIGYGNTVQVVAYKMGSVMAGGGLVAFLYHLGWSAIFLYLAVIYTLAILLTWVSDLRVRRWRPSQESRIMVGNVNPWSILKELFHVPGTHWTAGFVFIYKLGEQGSMSMFPLFLLDRDFSPQKLGFWNGIVAMIFSIAGSYLGGHLISRRRRLLPALENLLIVRFCGLTLQILLMALYQNKEPFFEVAAVMSICTQHLIAGLITTLTFSLMMHCSQKAKESIQATHYSFLATLEVLGKVIFGAVTGTLVDRLGFLKAFVVFLALSFTSILYTLPFRR